MLALKRDRSPGYCCHYFAPVGVRSSVINPSVCAPVCVSVCVCVCQSASMSPEPLDRSAHVVCRSPVAVARSSSDGVVLRYVLPALWMTSRLAAIGATPKGGSRHSATAINDVAIPMSMNACYHYYYYYYCCCNGLDAD